MIHCETRHLQMVKAVLAQHAIGLEVWAFGSRVTGERLKRFSDLDLAIITYEPLGAARLAALRTAFSESNLPFAVDVVEWASADEAFRRIIESAHERL